MSANDDQQFSVCQFFEDGTNEYVRRYVDIAEAMCAFLIYTRNPAALIGITRRVIITDGGDCIAAEWEFGKGLTFPPTGKERLN